ncbi:hypothetical protein E8E11_003280 [Didymella keratinophila]|nr:hypothetical protein E8E11_003280 [Didymella keratinophila]
MATTMPQSGGGALPRSSSRPPAEPLLASTLLAPSTLDSILDTLIEAAGPTHGVKNVLALKIPALDAALTTTFQPSSLVALSADSAKLLSSFSKQLLVDALLRYPEHGVAVVDTTGNFDVVGLYQLVLAQLEREQREAGTEMRSGEGMQEIAAKTLDRVRILRVFDFVGMREAIGELSDGLEGKGLGHSGVSAVDREREGSTAGKGGAEEGPPRKMERTEVADSEDEEEDLEDEDDEMLFDVPNDDTTPGSDPVQTLPPNPIANASAHLAGPDQQATVKLASHPPLKTILIDNLAHVLTPLLKQDTISANTLVGTFLTTLSNLTSAHALHTILLNPCTTPRHPSPSRKPADNAAPGPERGYTPQPPPPPSIFSSNGAVPALLGLMSRYADAHVLVSMLPRRKLDARVYYADSGGRDRRKRRGVEMVGVVEVIADRRGGRVGAWGAFREGKDDGIVEL